MHLDWLRHLVDEEAMTVFIMGASNVSIPVCECRRVQFHFKELICILPVVTKRTKVRDIIAFMHRKKYIPGIPHFFSYGFYVPGQHIPTSEFQTMGELGVGPLTHLHFIVGLLRGGMSFLRCYLLSSTNHL